VHSGNIPILDSIFEKSRIKPLVEMKSMGILLYNIFLNILTSYENYLESINDSIDRIEDKILENPSKELMSEIFFLKKVLLFMRKLAEPLKNVYAYFVRENPTIIMKKSIVYFRDIFFQYDRMMQSISSYNQIVSNIMEVYVSGLTLKLDEIIKFLTIIATIFMPAVIITSYYGMNVAFPEHRILGVNSVWFFAFAVIAVSTAGVYLYIKRKKWF